MVRKAKGCHNKCAETGLHRIEHFGDGHLVSAGEPRSTVVVLRFRSLEVMRSSEEMQVRPAVNEATEMLISEQPRRNQTQACCPVPTENSKAGHAPQRLKRAGCWAMTLGTRTSASCLSRFHPAAPCFEHTPTADCSPRLPGSFLHCILFLPRRPARPHSSVAVWEHLPRHHPHPVLAHHLSQRACPPLPSARRGPQEFSRTLL